METTSPVMSITDEQIAEIEALAKECKSQGDWYKDFDFTSFPEFDCDASFVQLCGPDYAIALISRLRAAERDAERYRWLRDYLRYDYKRWESAGAWNHANISPFEFDTAIDTAMKGEQQ